MALNSHLPPSAIMCTRFRYLSFSSPCMSLVSVRQVRRQDFFSRLLYTTNSEHTHPRPLNGRGTSSKDMHLLSLKTGFMAPYVMSLVIRRTHFCQRMMECPDMVYSLIRICQQYFINNLHFSHGAQRQALHSHPVLQPPSAHSHFSVNKQGSN